mmetsp:Transcript_86553/g.242404  ORF Transcript_86553/g.242404 Transcript_86553/m.242404 type:complete len:284 (+) Transcript_86553:2613-3464(+)
MLWNRGANVWVVAIVALRDCCTKRPRIRSASKPVGKSGIPSWSRFWRRDKRTTRGSRLKSSRVSWDNCPSTCCGVGGLLLATSSASPTISRSSSFNCRIAGKVSIKFLLNNTAPEKRPIARRRSMTSVRFVTVSIRDILSLTTSDWPHVVNTEKVHLVCNATSMVNASSPHRKKCQYLFELKESMQMLPAISPSIVRALSKPSVIGMKFGTYMLRFLLCGTPMIDVRQPTSWKQIARAAAHDKSLEPATITRPSRNSRTQMAITSRASSLRSSAEKPPSLHVP